MNNIQQALKQAQMLQAKMAELQKQLENETVEGAAGGGMVKITCTCKGDVRALDIDASLLTSDQKTMVEDLVIAAFNNAKSAADARTAQEVQKLSASAGIPADMLNSVF